MGKLKLYKLNKKNDNSLIATPEISLITAFSFKINSISDSHKLTIGLQDDSL